MHSTTASVPAPTTSPELAVELLRAENRILELVARNSPLEQVLHELAISAEQLVGDDVLCSILLLDDSGQHLLHGAAPNLPDPYNRQIHGLKIGPGVGSCGTAAATAEEVLVPDVSTHPYWAAFKDLAAEHGLAACWSTPIVSSSGTVLGTFAMYYRVPSVPSDSARGVVRLLTRTAALVLERDLAERQRQKSVQQVEALYRTGLQISGEHDLETIVQTATDAAREVSGAALGAFFYNMVNERGESYMLHTISGVPREKFSQFPMPRNTAVFAPTFSGEAVVRSHDITQDPRYGRNAPHHGMPKGHLPVRSYLAVPVKARNGEVIGGMFFGHPETGVFTEESERLVVSIAAQAGVAMENARLHENLRRQLQQFEDMAATLRQAQQAAAIATWKWDFTSGQINFTPGSAGISGVPLSEVRDHDAWLNQVHPEDRDEVLRICGEAIQAGEDYQVEYRVPFPEGDRWVFTRGHPVKDADGKAAALIGISIDVTQRKRAKDALRQSEKLAATGRLAATIAHEINNPLEAVTNFIYLARRNSELPPAVRRHLEIADRELSRVTHIAQQTLGFYRDTSVPVYLQLSDVVGDVLALYERKFAYKGIELRQDVEADAAIVALQGEIRQVLSNLVANSVDASDDGGRIWIRGHRTRNWRTGERGVRLLVADNGSGIDPAIQSKLFTPFLTTKKDVGTGLGLWVTKSMVQKHGGHIRFKSRPGKGTVFSLFFPAEARVKHAVAEAETATVGES